VTGSGLAPTREHLALYVGELGHKIRPLFYEVVLELLADF